jgi:hypothetical protein
MSEKGPQVSGRRGIYMYMHTYSTYIRTVQPWIRLVDGAQCDTWTLHHSPSKRQNGFRGWRCHSHRISHLSTLNAVWCLLFRSLGLQLCFSIRYPSLPAHIGGAQKTPIVSCKTLPYHIMDQSPWEQVKFLFGIATGHSLLELCRRHLSLFVIAALAARGVSFLLCSPPDSTADRADSSVYIVSFFSSFFLMPMFRRGFATYNTEWQTQTKASCSLHGDLFRRQAMPRPMSCARDSPCTCSYIHSSLCAVLCCAVLDTFKVPLPLRHVAGGPPNPDDTDAVSPYRAPFPQ